MSDDLTSRIERMHRGDKVGATVFVVALWCVILFVLVMVWQVVDDGMVRMVLAGAAGLLLILNTASIGAMLRHYAEDKQFIYSLDIRHLDAARAEKAGSPAGPASMEGHGG